MQRGDVGGREMRTRKRDVGRVDGVGMSVFEMLAQIGGVAREIAAARDGRVTEIAKGYVGVGVGFDEEIPHKRALLPLARRSVRGRVRATRVFERAGRRLARRLRRGEWQR